MNEPRYACPSHPYPHPYPAQAQAQAGYVHTGYYQGSPVMAPHPQYNNYAPAAPPTGEPVLGMTGFVVVTPPTGETGFLQGILECLKPLCCWCDDCCPDDEGDRSK